MAKYERKIPEDLDCGITIFMKAMGAKWKPCIIDAIRQGFTRPSEIHKQIAATPRVIDMQLSELEAQGMVAKKLHDGFPLRVNYSLTERGKHLLPIIALMDEWGCLHREIFQ
ncbi:helix-turn-helix domain-containing protein [Pedobacter heparinus]|jgi:DNA-binding HxlR family transcriptional regulator|uniref:winged helix-turn-helix transcriptional regulator n=1 Tax=Pedobacter heparinus TaxID=984 RepID=UPI00292FC1F6|nr:helix-turn-helix domain-containing protein [Pedobacter heparinus]